VTSQLAHDGAKGWSNPLRSKSRRTGECNAGTKGCHPADRDSRDGVPADQEHAEELVDLLMTATRRGEWRVVALMLDRVFGRPKETVALEQPEPEIISDLRALAPEERRDLLRSWNEPDEAAEAGG
jgi:hypothetical protein